MPKLKKWCDHVYISSKKYCITEYGIIMQADWVLCPVCGASKPEEEK